MLGGAVGTPVVTLGIRTAVGRTLAAGAAIGTAVMPLGIRTAVGRTLAAGAAVRTACHAPRDSNRRQQDPSPPPEVVMSSSLIAMKPSPFSNRGGLSQGPCAVG